MINSEKEERQKKKASMNKKYIGQNKSKKDKKLFWKTHGLLFNNYFTNIFVNFILYVFIRIPVWLLLY